MLFSIDFFYITRVTIKPHYTWYDTCKFELYPCYARVCTVEPLVVSAGDDKVIQLPNDQVTLSAFALPKDEEGKLGVHWCPLEYTGHKKPRGPGEGVVEMGTYFNAKLIFSITANHEVITSSPCEIIQAL